MMQLFCFLLLAGNLFLTAAVLRQVKSSPPQSNPQPPPRPTPPAQLPPDPVDQGFENIMRFTVGEHRRGGTSL